MYKLTLTQRNEKWIGRLEQATPKGWSQAFTGKPCPTIHEAADYCRNAAHQKGWTIIEDQNPKAPEGQAAEAAFTCTEERQDPPRITLPTKYGEVRYTVNSGTQVHATENGTPLTLRGIPYHISFHLTQDETTGVWNGKLWEQYASRQDHTGKDVSLAAKENLHAEIITTWTNYLTRNPLTLLHAEVIDKIDELATAASKIQDAQANLANLHHQYEQKARELQHARERYQAARVFRDCLAT